MPGLFNSFACRQCAFNRMRSSLHNVASYRNFLYTSRSVQSSMCPINYEYMSPTNGLSFLKLLCCILAPCYTILSLYIYVHKHSLQCRFLFVLLPLLHDMVRSHKGHRQVCTLLQANCYTVATLIIRYVFNSFFTSCT
jgi:hypothetical protein